MNSFKTFCSIAALFIWTACAFSTKAQDGTYKASESWSVTVYRGSGDVATTFTGRETGTLVVTGGSYTQINHAGAALPARLNTGMTIDYDGYNYNISGAYPFSAEGSGLGGFYAVIQLSFFVIKVPLGTQADIPNPYPYGSSVFTTTGTDLSSLSGAGTMVDQAAGFGPVGPSYFIDEVDASSTSSLTPVAPPGTAAPTITTQPRSQSVSLGASATLTVSAAGTEPLSYQWTHDGTNLVDAGEFSGSTNSALTISGVEAADAGTYSVVISNARGSVTSAKAVLSVGASITAQSTEGGKITPTYGGETLPIGKKYTITATPNAGYLFAGWSGSITTNTPALAFVLESNLVLEANFVPNPFIPDQGTFNGLFLNTNDVTEASSGFFTLALTKSGAFTGKIMTAGSTYSLPTLTPFDAAGQVQFTVPTGQSTLTFNLQLNLSDPASQQITGTVSDGAWTAVLTADRAVFSATTNKALDYAGQYTLAIAGSEDAAASPGGFGCATVSISPAGLITMKGYLADGTAISQSVSVSKDGR
jgi:hypothetical protein